MNTLTAFAAQNNREAEAEHGTEYLLVSDKTSKVLKSSHGLKALAGIVRKGGGEVTIFKSTRG